MKQIASRDNPAFKDLRDLARDGRRQRNEERAILEGAHLVAAALDHEVMPQLLVVSESGADQPEVKSLLSRCDAAAVLCLRDALFRDVSLLDSPQGILAVIAVPPASTFQPAGDCLLLDAIQDAGNVGTLLRTAAAAGVRDVLLGPGCAAAWSQKVLRAGQGAHFALNIHEQVALESCLEDYRGVSVAAVAHDGVSVFECDYQRPVAWIFGSEGAGVSAGLVNRANTRASIPLAPGSESLNVAAAAAICLFEMRRQRTMKKSTPAGRQS